MILKSFILLTVPQAFASWWISWNRYDPHSFPLPLPLRLSDDEWTIDDDTKFLPSVRRPSQSSLSHDLTIIWSQLEEFEGDLMLFCWAKRSRKAKVERERLGHPTTHRVVAEAVLSAGLSGELEALFPLARSMISIDPERFPETNVVHPA